MVINTEHNVSDPVWTIHDNKAMQLFVVSIGVEPYENNVNYDLRGHIYYILRSANKIHQGVRRHEGSLFSTKEELLQSL